MLNFQLSPGDRYDGRCAEIYITEKQFLIYHCSVCEEIFATFNELLSHITKHHYTNCTKEYKKVNENQSVAIVNTQEGEQQLAAKVLGNQSISKNLANDNKELDKEETVDTKINQTHYSQENEDKARALGSSKTSPQRKKARFISDIIKSNVTTRTKLNALVCYQPNEERKYICGVCGFAFKEKHNLRSHLQRHSNQKNFSCNSCPKRFFTKLELRVHEYRHKSERPYICQHCGMGFVSSESLKQHLKKLHSSHCAKEPPNLYKLKGAPIVHEKEERNFECLVCKNSFNKKLLENNSNFPCENCDLELSRQPKTLKNLIHQNKKYNSEKANVFGKTKVSDNVRNNDGMGEWTIEEGELCLEPNFDEYELVQTLTDLECRKRC